MKAVAVLTFFGLCLSSVLAAPSASPDTLQKRQCFCANGEEQCIEMGITIIEGPC